MGKKKKRKKKQETDWGPGAAQVGCMGKSQLGGPGPAKGEGREGGVEGVERGRGLQSSPWPKPILQFLRHFGDFSWQQQFATFPDTCPSIMIFPVRAELPILFSAYFRDNN